MKKGWIVSYLFCVVLFEACAEVKRTIPGDLLFSVSSFSSKSASLRVPSFSKKSLHSFILQLPSFQRKIATLAYMARTDPAFVLNTELLSVGKTFFDRVDWAFFSPADFSREMILRPLAFLSECDGASCPLSRAHRPKVRAFFMDQLIDVVKKNYPDRDRTLICTSFGSGSLFTDLLFLIRLSQEGYRRVHLNLIEQHWVSFISSLQGKEGFFWRDFFDQDRLENLIALQFTQFLYFLAATCHFTDISLTIYADIVDYANKCEQNFLFKSDLIYGIDFLDGAYDDRIAAANAFSLLAVGGLKSGGILGWIHNQLSMGFKQIRLPLTCYDVYQNYKKNFEQNIGSFVPNLIAYKPYGKVSYDGEEVALKIHLKRMSHPIAQYKSTASIWKEICLPVVKKSEIGC